MPECVFPCTWDGAGACKASRKNGRVPLPSGEDRAGLTTTVCLPTSCNIREAVYLLLSSSIWRKLAACFFLSFRHSSCVKRVISPSCCSYLLVVDKPFAEIGNELFEAFGVHYLLAFQPIRKFHHRFLSHAVDECIGTAVDEDAWAYTVLPIVVVRQTAHACFDATQYDGDIGK